MLAFHLSSAHLWRVYTIHDVVLSYHCGTAAAREDGIYKESEVEKKSKRKHIQNCDEWNIKRYTHDRRVESRRAEANDMRMVVECEYSAQSRRREEYSQEREEGETTATCDVKPGEMKMQQISRSDKNRK